MAEAAHGDHVHGHMEIKDQKDTFDGFIAASIWGCSYVAQFVALFTLAFAINIGWWAGMAAFVAIGVGIGLFFKQGGVWWAVLIALTVLLGIGGVIVPLVSGLAG